jgi:hypothetical protein
VNREYVLGLPCKGHKEDGDSLLWGGLMYASGENVVNGILRSQAKSGQFHRSPLRKIAAEQNVAQVNSFSRDMATGLSLAAAKAKFDNNQRLLDAYQRWIDFTLKNKCKACLDDTDGRCIMTPGVYWFASEIGVKVPLIFKVTKFLNSLYLYIAAKTNDTGYVLHLVGVSLMFYVVLRGGREKLSFLQKKACKILAKRQPLNPFFCWLAREDDKAAALTLSYKSHILTSGQGRMHQWGWERDDKEEAWKDSCGHDIVFMENLISSKL